MNLHLPALPAHVVLQPASRRLKSIADYNIDVFVLRMRLDVFHPSLFGAACMALCKFGSCRTTILPRGTPSSMRT